MEQQRIKAAVQLASLHTRRQVESELETKYEHDINVASEEVRRRMEKRIAAQQKAAVALARLETERAVRSGTTKIASEAAVAITRAETEKQLRRFELDLKRRVWLTRLFGK